MQTLNKLYVRGLGVALLVGSSAAMAEVDTAGITAGVADAATAVATIGAAVVLVVLGIKVYKWIARSL